MAAHPTTTKTPSLFEDPIASLAQSQAMTQIATAEPVDNDAVPDISQLEVVMETAKGETPIEAQADTAIDLDHDAPLDLTAEQIQILTSPLTDDELDVKPDRTASIYVSHTVIRDRLNRAFKPFRWRMRPVSGLLRDAKTNMLYRQFALDVAIGARWYRGPVAMGEQEFLTGGNSTMTWGDAIEGCESIGLSRLGKRIGIHVDRRRAEKFRQEVCVLVWVEKRNGEKGTAWRRADSPPLYGETGIVDDSPNKTRYKKPMPPWWHERKPRESQTTNSQRPTNGGTPAARPASDYISLDQQQALWKAARDAGFDDHEVAARLAQDYDVKSTSQLLKADFDKIMTWIASGGD